MQTRRLLPTTARWVTIWGLKLPSATHSLLTPKEKLRRSGPELTLRTPAMKSSLPSQNSTNTNRVSNCRNNSEHGTLSRNTSKVESPVRSRAFCSKQILRLITSFSPSSWPETSLRLSLERPSWRPFSQELSQPPSWPKTSSQLSLEQF